MKLAFILGSNVIVVNENEDESEEYQNHKLPDKCSHFQLIMQIMKKKFATMP